MTSPVVGSGFSAIAVTINHSSCYRLASIAIVGRRSRFSGEAPPTEPSSTFTGLNVPAGRKSVLPMNRMLLSRAAARGKGGRGRRILLRAGDYGRYLRDRLAALSTQPRGQSQCRFCQGKGTKPASTARGQESSSSRQSEELSANNVVLCLGVGNAPLPVSPQNLDAKAHARIVPNPGG